MDIKAIKELDDKSTIDGISATIEKQYPPADQTDNDLKFSQHRQSFLVNDGTEKLMVTLMKSQLHILDPKEGHVLHLSAGRNEHGELRGLILNRWQKAGDKYPSITLKVYPEATIRITSPSGGSNEQSSSKQPELPANMSNQSTSQSNELPATESTEFFKHLQLASYGYCLCLDQAEKVIEDRPELKGSPENLRAIATNFWMECKHHVRTLAPNLNSSKPIARGAAAPAQAVAPNQESNEADDGVIMTRLLAGYKFKEENVNDRTKFTPAVEKSLEKLAKAADGAPHIWSACYDLMEESVREEFAGQYDKAHIDKAFSKAYKKAHKAGNAMPEKLFVKNQSIWHNEILTNLTTDE